MYTQLKEQCHNLVDRSLPPLSNLSNLLALVFYEMQDINWIGLYILNDDNNQCTLGPFQGKVACTKIPYGKGVVGTCAALQETIVVQDVHQFQGHIACDCDSKSEIVCPIYKEKKCLAILDVDSPKLSRFQELEKDFFEFFAHLISTL